MTPSVPTPGLDSIESCAALLRGLAAAPASEAMDALEQAASAFLAERVRARRAKARAEATAIAERRERKRAERERDLGLLNATFQRRPGLGDDERQARPGPVVPLGGRHPRAGRPRPRAHDVTALARARRCYVCRSPFTALHFYYDSLCPPCAELNLAKRVQSADLRGRVALVTGGRVGLGFQVVLKLLRAGARVVTTTRFAHNARDRYAREHDAASWLTRLRVEPLDLRSLVAVEAFAEQTLAREPRLDILVNLAAQTIRRPPAFYRELVTGEIAAGASSESSAGADLGHSAEQERESDPPGGLAEGDAREPQGASAGRDQDTALASAGDDDFFPRGASDAFGRPLDLRPQNSWRLSLDEVSVDECLEVHVVNAVAPFALVSRLLPRLIPPPGGASWVVHVAAVEGQFSAHAKTHHHPHTNMAKAALNMLTRTTAAHCAEARVYINSVDPGWFSPQGPHRPAGAGAAPARLPLDAIDGAARVCDPFFIGTARGDYPFGKLFKDYFETDW